MSLVASPASPQIGGKTAADGPFTLDNVEDLDLVAGGVMRGWVYGTLSGGAPTLAAIPLATSGLTLATTQTVIGTLRFQTESKAGVISDSFGVPMPSVAGASTLTDPGNITTFTHLVFLACFSPVIPGQVFDVILETYPGPAYPKIYWSFTPAPGTAFQEVYVDLWHPGLIQNAGTLTLAELLGQTRYLSFYCYATGAKQNETLTFYVDDTRLVNLPSGSPTPTPSPIPTSTPASTATPSPSPTPPVSEVPSSLWSLYDEADADS